MTGAGCITAPAQPLVWNLLLLIYKKKKPEIPLQISGWKV
jgi:hypothetical protein